MGAYATVNFRKGFLKVPKLLSKYKYLEDSEMWSKDWQTKSLETLYDNHEVIDNKMYLQTYKRVKRTKAEYKEYVAKNITGNEGSKWYKFNVEHAKTKTLPDKLVLLDLHGIYPVSKFIKVEEKEYDVTIMLKFTDGLLVDIKVVNCKLWKKAA